METISFARGVPAPDCLPVDELADCARAAIARDGAAALLYGHTLGYQPLREWIGRQHDVDAARVVVTNGSLQAFHFVSSSFSKTIAPGLRVGYVIVPLELAEELEDVVASTYITPALVTQATVLEFLRRGRLEPNLERVRGLLRARRDAMVEALERELDGRARWSRPEGGYFLWLELAEGTDAAALLARAAEAGVTFVPGADFGGAANSARLAFSFASPEEIDEGVARLGALLPAAAPVELR